MIATMACEYVSSNFVLLFLTAFCSLLSTHGQLQEGELVAVYNQIATICVDAKLNG